MDLRRCWAKADIDLHRVAVGDRYILEKMRNDGLNLGGEPSGHILMTDFARSGDGLLTALQMLTLLKGSTKKASSCLIALDLTRSVLKT